MTIHNHEIVVISTNKLSNAMLNLNGLLMFFVFYFLMGHYLSTQYDSLLNVSQSNKMVNFNII